MEELNLNTRGMGVKNSCKILKSLHNKLLRLKYGMCVNSGMVTKLYMDNHYQTKMHQCSLEWFLNRNIEYMNKSSK